MQYLSKSQILDNVSKHRVDRLRDVEIRNQITNQNLIANNVQQFSEANHISAPYREKHSISIHDTKRSANKGPSISREN